MRCCLCHKEINGYGNNPWGALNIDLSVIKWKKNARCCDECNREIVIPGRILKYVNNRNR